jgi:lysozyme
LATARRKISDAGLNFVAGWEGFRPTAYNDAAGHATIGFGHLLHTGPVTALDRKRHLTRAQGLKLFRQDMRRFEDAVNRYVTVPLEQAQFDALCSFAFNVGIIGFRDSTLLRHLNNERRTAAADEFLKWNKAGGRTLEGLTRRRQAERKMFLTGIRKPGNKPKPKKPWKPYATGPSKSFTWLEVHRGRKPWTLALRARAILHARKLERVKARVNAERAKHGLKPTGMNVLSWYRPEWYNKKIGGAKFSRHIKADATDISLQEIMRLCPWRTGKLDFDRICNEVFKTDGFGQYPAGSRHVDSRGFRARWSTWSS